MKKCKICGAEQLDHYLICNYPTAGGSCGGELEVIYDKKFIYFPQPKIDTNSIIFYGAGKFQEERLVLSREQAALAYIELHKFLFGKDN